MFKPSPYALLVCCWLFVSGLRVCAASADTAIGPVTLVPSSPSAPLTLRIRPDTALRHYANIRLEWQLFLNGLPTQKGIISHHSLIPGRPTLIHLPLRLPPGQEEAYLRVTGRKPLLPGARTTPSPLFTCMLPLRPWQQDNSIAPTGDLTFGDTLDVFTITSAGARLQFDKQTGWLLRYEAGPVLLMIDTAGLQPALWNPAVQPHLQLFSTSTGTQMVIVRAEYTVPETGCLLHLSYTINAAGEMLVGESLEIDTTRQPPATGGPPQIPTLSRFGMSWTLPPGLDSVTWYGLAKATDSDAAPGISCDSAIDDVPGINRLPVTPGRESTYPNVRWLTITGADGTGLRILADSSLLRILTLDKTKLEIDACNISPAHSVSPVPAGLIHYAFKVTPVMRSAKRF